MKYIIHLSLGSNLDRETNYPAAVRLLKRFGEIEAVSPVYETPAMGMEPGTPSFFNGAVRMRTDCEPAELKDRLRREVEEALGRVRDPGGAWISRPIDADIVLWRDEGGGYVRPPDPDVVRWLHVARPLADLDPDLELPIPGHPDGRTLAEIARALEKEQPLPVPRPDFILNF